MNNKPQPEPLRDRLSGLGLFWLSQLVHRTCKFHVINANTMLSAIKSEKPIILAGWHGVTMMAVPLLLNWHPDLSKFVVLMPDDWRGSALRIWTEKLGARPYPMNLKGDSTLGMARKLVGLTREVMGGNSLYITPDGPDGPAHVLKPGIVYLSQKTGAMILPIGAYCRHSYTVARWDRYTIPYPYSRITIHIGEPLLNLPEEQEPGEKIITETLNRVTLQAAADYYEQWPAKP